MSFSNLPVELRHIAQWTVYRSVIRGDDVIKPPFRLDDPTIGASVHDPSGWGSYDHAVAVYNANKSVFSGIGFMLTEADPYIVVDVDKIEKVAPENLGYRAEFEKQVLALGSYSEHSPSGRGMHVWLKGRIPMAGKHLKAVGSEVYAWQRFITCTGKPVAQHNASGIIDGQDFLHMVGLGEAPPEVALTDDPNKPMHLTDYEVYRQACQFVSTFYPRFHGQLGCDQGEWSHTFVAVVGVLDKLTGSVAQVVRMMQQSPMVVSCPPAMSGETRANKCNRTIYDVMSRVRRGNRASGYFVEHGRKVFEAMEARRQGQAELAMREQEAALAQQLDAANAGGGFSPAVNTMLSRFGLLTTEHRVLSVPPGVAGEFVYAANAASKAPFIKFAIPATLATLSGITARAYVQDRKGALPLNYVLVAPSSTGKTQTMKVWHKFMMEAASYLPNTLQQRTRVLNNGTASIQGIMPDLQANPSCVWFIEEASAQLNGMSDPKTNTEENLRTCYNEFYDCGEHGQTFQPPRSVASRNANIVAIPKLCVSTYWTTTPNKFKIENNDVLDGFASRVVFIRHTGPGGLLVRETQPLPDHLRQILTNLLIKADLVDSHYNANISQAAAETQVIDTSAVQDLGWEMAQLCGQINHDALSGVVPETYTAVSRIPQSAMRLACTLAIVQNPWSPAVTVEQYKWAFGYLLQNMAALLSSMDAGEIGDKISDDFLAAERCYKELVQKGASKGLPGVPRSVLHTAMKCHQPFRTHRDGRSQAASRALENMLKEGFIEEVAGMAPTGRGRPPTYLRLKGAA